MNTKFCYECGAEKFWDINFVVLVESHFRHDLKITFVPNEQDIKTYNQHRVYLDKIYGFQSSFFNYMFFIIFISIALMVLTTFTIGFNFFNISLGGIFVLFAVFFILKFMELDLSLAKVIYGKNYEHKNESLIVFYKSLDSSKIIRVKLFVFSVEILDFLEKEFMLQITAPLIVQNAKLIFLRNEDLNQNDV